MSHGKRPDVIVHEQHPFNAEAPRVALGTPLTPLDAFYVRSHGPVPDDAAPDAARLRVGGLVERELDLSFGDLVQGFATREVVATLQCAGNRRAELQAVRDIPGEAPWGPGATSTARWGGVPLADVLAEAGVRPSAAHVAFAGTDRPDEAEPPQRYGASIPLAKALAPEVLLATTMNGAPLPPVHGAPLRAVVPGYVGARSVKWVDRVEVRETPWDGYYQAIAYRLLAVDEAPAPGAGVSLGEVPLSSAIVRPTDGDQVPAGDVRVKGYALSSGGRHVARVELSADGGRTWRRAELLEDQGPWAWRRWRCTVALGPGTHEVVARAWDSAAGTQPERAESVWNLKGYVNTSWPRVTLRAR